MFMVGGVDGTGKDTEKASYVLIASFQGFCRRLAADSLSRLVQL